MANPHGLTRNPGPSQPSGSTEEGRSYVNTDGSVAMEQSASNSSISSSIASFLTSSSSTSVQSPAYMPITPKQPPQSFDPAHHNSDDSHALANTHSSHSYSIDSANMTWAKKIDVKSLIITPPNAVLETFNNPNAGPTNGPSSHGPHVDDHGQVSPTSLKGTTEEAEPDNGVRDPILFLDQPSVLQNSPLFAANTTEVIKDAIASPSALMFREITPPNADGNRGVLLAPKFMEQVEKDRKGWLKRERAQLLADRTARAELARSLQTTSAAPRSTPPRPVARNPAPRTPKQQPPVQPAQGPSPSHRDQPNVLRPVYSSTNRVTKRANRAPEAQRTPLPNRIAPQVNGVVRLGSGSGQGVSRAPGSSPEPRVRTSAPNREDKDFNSLPNYCPPLSTLPERTNLLKVDWKGTPLDLSHDQYRHLLHPDELVLAASLRLDCATYLTSKRRVFIRRLECARLPKEFRKTDAQQACKIDVNKASKLWSAYQQVGWLRMDHIRHLL